MRAAVLEGGRFLVREYADPVPGPGQALVDIEACGICGSDLSAVAHTEDFLRASRDSGTTSFLFDPGRPLVMGHEFSGRVVAYGPGGSGPEPGTGVVGLPWAVDTGGVVRTVGYSNAFPGGFGERIVVQAQALLPVPDSLDLALASLTEPLAVGFGNIARSTAGEGTSAVVIGCGPVGLGAIAALLERGAGPVVASDPSALRRAAAAGLGAHAVVNPSGADPADARAAGPAGAGPVDPVALCAELAGTGARPMVVVNCVGVPGMLNTLLHTVPRGTEILQIGGVMTEDVIRPVVGIYKDVTIRMCLTYPPQEFGATLARLADGRIDPAALVTGEAGFGGLAAAFASLRRPEEHIKVLIRPDLAGEGVTPV
ncbi:zinc-binding dehydrogenase [Streptomyces sp. NPDC091371]|uniref:alcohol dehydrogenase catalytic domain-containing protein n=1 Tax=Streptomyces sp. NPDC091371 TaxID=3155303 RepID=UPI00342F757D